MAGLSAPNNFFIKLKVLRLGFTQQGFFLSLVSLFDHYVPSFDTVNPHILLGRRLSRRVIGQSIGVPYLAMVVDGKFLQKVKIMLGKVISLFYSKNGLIIRCIYKKHAYDNNLYKNRVCICNIMYIYILGYVHICKLNFLRSKHHIQYYANI